MEKQYGFVYMTINKIDGKKYIGKCVYTRQNDWQKYLGSGVYLKRAIQKHGKQSFERIILEEAENEESLRLLEEKYISLHDAVNSPDYYNLKMTSIGGDTFNCSSDIERTRKLKADNMSGAKNHQYGKKKTKTMIQAVKMKNSSAIEVDNVRYSSLSEASSLLNLKVTTISWRLDSSNFPTYKRLSEKKNVQRQATNKKKAFIAEGQRFESIANAAKHFNVSKYCISNRIKSKNFPSWYLVDEENL